MPATLTLKRKKRNGLGKKKGEVDKEGEERKVPYFFGVSSHLDRPPESASIALVYPFRARGEVLLLMLYSSHRLRKELTALVTMIVCRQMLP